MLRDRKWKLKYTPDDGDLVRLFYVPALEEAERYDRLTGYFNAGALALAARGLEGLVRNRGRMRLIVGCTLAQPEIEAIERGEDLRVRVEQRLADLPLAPPDADASGALELLAWMGRSRSSRREGGSALRRERKAGERRRHFPREGRHRRGPHRREDRLER